MSNSQRKFRRAYYRRTGRVWCPTQSVQERQQVEAEANHAEVERILSRASRPPWWRVAWVYVLGTLRLWLRKLVPIMVGRAER